MVAERVGLFTAFSLEITVECLGNIIGKNDTVKVRKNVLGKSNIIV